MSRSCRVTSSSRFKRRISSSPAGGFPLPGKAFSPVFANSLHQWCSVLSAMPRSRATCACDFPLLCANCTASSLNSRVKVRCSFGMMPSCWMPPFKFISSKKVRQAHSTKSSCSGVRRVKPSITTSDGGWKSSLRRNARAAASKVTLTITQICGDLKDDYLTDCAKACS